MTEKELAIHSRAVLLSNSHRTVESDLVSILIEVSQSRVHHIMNKPSVFMYAVDILGFSEPTAYTLTAVARKCVQIPELRTAISEHRLTVSKASRLVSALTSQNASELIAMAMHSSWREIERAVARISPRTGRRTRTRYITEDKVEVTIEMSHAAYLKYKRVESLEAQRGNLGDFHEALYDEYIAKHDKVARADRAMEKQRANSTSAPEGAGVQKYSVRTEKRVPLGAELTHQVFHRDRGRCTHVDSEGRRCNQDRWVEIHHIVPVSDGGTNSLENLTTLCSFHHDLIHQMTFDLGEIESDWPKD